MISTRVISVNRRLCIGRVEQRGEGQDLADNQAADDGARKRAEPPDHNDHKALDKELFTHVRDDSGERRVDYTRDASGHRTEREHDHEGPAHVSTQELDHERILDPCAHHKAYSRAIQQQVETEQDQRGDADRFHAIERIEEEVEVDDALSPGRNRHALALATEGIADTFDHHDGETERDKDLILMRPVIVETDQSALKCKAENKER
jgi:hypothetical protein